MHSGTASDSLAREAYLIVRQKIMRGELRLGQPVSRRRLADEFGMSFVPVSEALQRLEFEGLVESQPRAGTRVRIPSRQDVTGHYVVREALEVQAARLFAGTVSREECTELMNLAARLDKLRQTFESNRFRFLTLHERLHRRIAEYARCRALSEAIEKTHARASLWLVGCKNTNGVTRQHRDLVESLVKGDPEEAVAAMRAHIANSRQNALERMEPFFALRRRTRTFTRATGAK
jgi:GntR family transcriptional regulator, rspAB operon transcriptional repressor